MLKGPEERKNIRCLFNNNIKIQKYSAITARLQNYCNIRGKK
jgi:hypothetical protein